MFTPKAVQGLNRQLSPELASRLLWIPDEARGMATVVVASRGTGKSRLLARIMAWQDFVKGVPLVILDPTGSMIQNFLDKFTRLPDSLQQRLLSRLLYVDTASVDGYVVPFPLVYKAGNETLFAVAQRYLDVVCAIDSSLSKAPILGANAIYRTGSNVGMILAACGLQITEAPQLLHDPSPWLHLIRAATTKYPELKSAVDFLSNLLELQQTKPQDYSRQIDTYLNKLTMFTLDPVMRSMFGAGSRGINWQEVADRRLAVLIDFHHENDVQRLRFKLFWIFFADLMEYIRRRGPGRHRPLAVMIDEFTYLLPSDQSNNDVFTGYLTELISRLSRNNRIWLTVALQELHQTNEQIRKTLLTMGNLILGSTTDPRTALELAQRFFPYDPYLIKKTEVSFAGRTSNERTTEFTKDEQRELNSRHFLNLPRFHFLVGVSPTEGTMPTKLTPISIERIDKNQFVDNELVGKLQDTLVRKGRKISDILAEIDSRHQGHTVPSIDITNNQPNGKMNVNDHPLFQPKEQDDDDIPLRDKK